MIDPETGSVVWAEHGPWIGQHDAQFLNNGHLLVFDNKGAASGSRVLELDPQTQAFPWSYPGESDPAFFSNERGECQRLPNGNTLIVVSAAGQILEVTPSHEVAWTCFLNSFVSTARRYAPNNSPS